MGKIIDLSFGETNYDRCIRLSEEILRIADGKEWQELDLEQTMKIKALTFDFAIAAGYKPLEWIMSLMENDLREEKKGRK